MSTSSQNGGSDKRFADMVRQETTAGSEPPIVIFVASTTPEKLRDFQAIAESRRVPVHFEDIRKLIKMFHSIDEVAGKFSGNAEAKLQGIDRYMYRFQHNPEVIEQYCQEHGIAFKKDHIYFATEDTGFSVPKRVWDAVDKNGIPKEKLRSIEKQGDGVSGPGVETGPVVSATLGGKILAERIFKAVDKVCSPEEDVKMYEHSTVTMKCLTDPETAPPMHFYKQVTNHLLRPQPGRIDIFDEKIATHHFMRCNGSRDKSCADMGEEYITRYSPRARVVDSIVGRLREDKKIGIRSQPKSDGPWKPGRRPHHDFAVGFLPAQPEGPQLADWADQLIHKRQFVLPLTDVAYLRDDGALPAPASNYDVLGSVENVVKNSDGILLLPSASGSEGKTREQQDLDEFTKLYSLFSLAVAKQLIVRDAEKPMVIMNHKGSWDNAIRIHNELANFGLTKEHNISWPPDVLPRNGIRLRSNSYFDIVDGDDYDAVRDTALEIMDKKREAYHRLADDGASARKPVEEGGFKPEEFKGFKVAIFCSASCENKFLNKNVKSLAYELSKRKFGVVYGGGDRYTMGAVLNGVMQHRKELEDRGMLEEDARKQAYVAGISTEPIIVVESQFGKFNSGLSYYKQAEDIYQRMGDMLEASDAVVVAPGGAGTVQEWAALLMLKKLRPDAFKDKHMVIYNPPLNNEHQKIWNHTLTVVLGEEFRECIEHPGRAAAPLRERFRKRLEELDISIESSKEAVEHTLESLRADKETGHVAGLASRVSNPSASIGSH
jgi:predicted Rossmann-fold nucleotide-binding protein